MVGGQIRRLFPTTFMKFRGHRYSVARTNPFFPHLHRSPTTRKSFKFRTSMDRLPLEILSSIYVISVPIPPCTISFDRVHPLRDRIRSLNLLRSVSKRWNNAILNIPQLWSYIEVSATTGDPRLLLKRSKAVPLHVRIKFGIGQTDSSFRDAVKALWATANRWKTYMGVGYVFGSSLRLLPPCSLPNVEEVWLAGFVGNDHPTIQAPRMKKLVECSSTPTFGTAGAPTLKRWDTAFPVNRLEWERLIQVVQLCPSLEFVEFVHTEYTPPAVLASGLTQVADYILFPALKKLVMDPATRRFDFLPYVRAPQLDRIVFQHYKDFFPFPIPSSSTCPNLSRIQFVGASGFRAIQEWVLTVPKEISERVGVEIEYHQQRNAAGAYEPVIADLDSLWRPWFDKHFPVKWIPVISPS